MRQRPASLAAAWIPVAVALSGALFACLYALSAYAVDPAALPLAMLAALAVGLGLWRLEYGIGLLVVCVPFTENAPISDPAGAKLRIALIMWAVVLVAAQGVRLTVSQRRIEAPPLFTSALVFVGAAVLSVPLASNVPSAAAKFLLIAGSVAIYALAATFLRGPRQIKPVLAAFVAVALLVSVHTLYQYLTGEVSRIGFISESGSVEYRVASFFPHPNQLAGFLIVLVPVCVALIGVFRTPSARFAAGAAAALSTVAVLLTYSRGALLALAALALVYAARKAASVAVVGAVVVAVAFAPSGWEDRVAGIAETDRPEIATRIDFWDASLSMAESKPILGVGLNNFAEAYVGLERAGRTFLGGGYFAAPETAHNVYLNTLAEQGAVGLAALALLVVAVGRLAQTMARDPDPRVRALGRGLVGAGVVLLVHNFFDVTFLDPKTATVIWALFGVCAAVAARDRGPETW